MIDEILEQIERVYVKLIKNNPKIFAIINLHMKGNWTIKGFMVKKNIDENRPNRNHGNLHICPPVMIGGKKAIWIEDEFEKYDRWYEFEDFLMEEYHNEVRKNSIIT